MKIAAYQGPLLPTGSSPAIGLLQDQIRRCEDEGVQILCCPEAFIGGLADYALRPVDLAIRSADLSAVFADLASDSVAEE